MEIDSEIYKVSTNSSYLKIMRELSSSKQSSILELRVDGETCKGEYVSDGFYMSILTLKSPGCEIKNAVFFIEEDIKKYSLSLEKWSINPENGRFEIIMFFYQKVKIAKTLSF